MPGEVTHFQKDWLQERDENGHILSFGVNKELLMRLCVFFVTSMSNMITRVFHS